MNTGRTAIAMETESDQIEGVGACGWVGGGGGGRYLRAHPYEGPYALTRPSKSIEETRPRSI